MNRSKWGALLVGTAQVADNSGWDPLPGVANNLSDLASALRSDLVGVPDVRTVLNPDRVRDVMEPLHSMSEKDLDLLLMYYAGHGRPDSQGALRLALTGTTQQNVDWESLRASEISVLVYQALAPLRILIVDSCCSGQITSAQGSVETVVASGLFVEDIITIASAPATELARAPKGARHTAFTGTLLDQMQSGDPDFQGDYLPLGQLLRNIRRELLKRKLPRPQVRLGLDGERLEFSRNAARRPKHPATPVDSDASLVGPRGQTGLVGDWVRMYKAPQERGLVGESWTFSRESASEGRCTRHRVYRRGYPEHGARGETTWYRWKEERQGFLLLEPVPPPLLPGEDPFIHQFLSARGSSWNGPSSGDALEYVVQSHQALKLIWARPGTLRVTIEFSRADELDSLLNQPGIWDTRSELGRPQLELTADGRFTFRPSDNTWDDVQGTLAVAGVAIWFSNLSGRGITRADKLGTIGSSPGLADFPWLRATKWSPAYWTWNGAHLMIGNDHGGTGFRGLRRL